METPIHQESQSIAKWLRFLVVCIVVLLVVLAVWLPGKREILPKIIAFASGLIVLLIFLAMVMKVVVTSSELRFGFPFWRVRFPLKDIEVLGVEPIPLMAGIGIHYYRGKWVYNARQGQGIHLVYRKEKHYLISSDNPEALFCALKTATTPFQWERESAAHKSG
jgi:hypothetical protein